MLHGFSLLQCHSLSLAELVHVLGFQWEEVSVHDFVDSDSHHSAVELEYWRNLTLFCIVECPLDNVAATLDASDRRDAWTEHHFLSLELSGCCILSEICCILVLVDEFFQTVVEVGSSLLACSHLVSRHIHGVEHWFLLVSGLHEHCAFICRLEYHIFISSAFEFSDNAVGELSALHWHWLFWHHLHTLILLTSWPALRAASTLSWAALLPSTVTCFTLMVSSNSSLFTFWKRA